VTKRKFGGNATELFSDSVQWFAEAAVNVISFEVFIHIVVTRRCLQNAKGKKQSVLHSENCYQPREHLADVKIYHVMD